LKMDLQEFCRLSPPTRSMQSAADTQTTKNVGYSCTPLASINLAALPSSRFLLRERRALPYRDESGRGNLHLCRFSAFVVLPTLTGCPREAEEKLARWLRHAERWASTTTDGEAPPLPLPSPAAPAPAVQPALPPPAAPPPAMPPPADAAACTFRRKARKSSVVVRHRPPPSERRQADGARVGGSSAGEGGVADEVMAAAEEVAQSWERLATQVTAPCVTMHNGVQLHLSQRSKTGYRGVKIELGGKSKKRRRPCFVAQLQSKQGGRGRNVMLGRYETPVEAAVAYARAVERRRVEIPTPFK